MLLKKWDPFKEFEKFFDDFKKLGEKEWALDTFSPDINIIEDDKKVKLEVEVPGVDKKDIEISVENGILTIKGEKKYEKEDKDKNYIRVERKYGKFERSFSIPDYLEVDKIKAKYENGVLHIEIPKKEEALPKKIKVDIK